MYRRATEAQLRTLQELGIEPPSGISQHRANELIQAHEQEWSRLPMTPKQEQFLRYRGQLCPGMTITRGVAAKLIEAIMQREGTCWRPPQAGAEDDD
jgi:hypothetical protein